VRIRSLVGAVGLSLSIAGVALAAGQAPERVDPFDQVKRMQRGVNIIGYDPIWKNFSKARFKEKHFKLIHDAGFQTVRINLHALGHMGAANQLDPEWMTTLDWAVKNALANGLMVILDLHNFTDVAKAPERYRAKIMAFWRQASAHFKDAPSSVVFEVLNEPNGKLTPELWNVYLHEALAIIRETNPTRTVIAGPPFWNGIRHLQELQLPKDDRNLIVTVHYYEPMTFTHQSAPWNKETAHLSGVHWGTDAEKEKVGKDFAMVQEWSKAENRPIFLGEFGAYDKADNESRARYLSQVARTAESLGWAWAYWQFDADFILYDITKDEWTTPLLKALVP